MKNQIIAALALLAMMAAPLHAAKISKSEFNKKMRELWADHGTWTREYIVSAVADNNDAAKEAAKRLMKNQEDLGSTLVPFYGAAAGKKMTALLKEHINFAVEQVAAAKKNDSKAFKAADTKLHKNGAEISSFLSAANPQINIVDMKMMFNDHLKLLSTMLMGRIKKHYAKDVSNFDAGRQQLNNMADFLTNALISQQRDKFR